MGLSTETTENNLMIKTILNVSKGKVGLCFGHDIQQVQLNLFFSFPQWVYWNDSLNLLQPFNIEIELLLL